MRTITSALTVLPAGESILSEQATLVELVDEAAGPFLAVTQDRGAVRIDPDEWPALRAAINRMVRVAREQERAEARG